MLLLVKCTEFLPMLARMTRGSLWGVMLKIKVGFGECDWDVGPGGAEMLAFAHMRDCAEIFFPLLLRLVDRLV